MLLELLGIATDKLIIFRSVLGCLAAFCLSFICIPAWILVQKIRSISERVEIKHHQRLDTQLESKKDTPTLGGIIIYISTLGGLATVSRITNEPVLTLLSIVSIFFLIGLGDDISKFLRNGRGLSITSKLSLQMAAFVFCSLMLYHYVGSVSPVRGTSLYIPFFGYIELGYAYIAVLIFGFIVFTNGVNFADGMDGLAAGTFSISLIGLISVAYISSRFDFIKYIGLPHITGSGELVVFLSALLGGLIGFLWYNCHPAQIFMGDCGSLALGSVMISLSAMTKTEHVLLGLGLFYILEFLSSFVQVGIFRLFKFRLFPIAPFHHIPAIKDPNYKRYEGKYVIRFIIFHAFLCMASLFLLKIR